MPSDHVAKQVVGNISMHQTTKRGKNVQLGVPAPPPVQYQPEFDEMFDAEPELYDPERN